MYEEISYKDKVNPQKDNRKNMVNNFGLLLIWIDG